MKQKMIIIQPTMTKYRLPIFEELAHKYKLYVIYSSSKVKEGFGIITAPSDSGPVLINVKSMSLFKNKIVFQRNLIKNIIKINPNVVIASASLRDIGFWTILFFCRLKRIKFYCWGHGPYNKEPNIFRKIIYQIVLSNSMSYFAYTQLSLIGFLKHNVSIQKVKVLDNTIINNYQLDSLNKDFSNYGILFIGRLREGTNLELLINSMSMLLKKYPLLKLHVIGNGVFEDYYKKKYEHYNFINWHGQIYDNKIIMEISKECILGCNPGTAGLSLVHYMSLSLPIVVHRDIIKHGPEISYIKDDYNAKMFKNGDVISLYGILDDLLSNKKRIEGLSINSYETYKSISYPTTSMKISSIIEKKDENITN